MSRWNNGRGAAESERARARARVSVWYGSRASECRRAGQVGERRHQRGAKVWMGSDGDLVWGWGGLGHALEVADIRDRSVPNVMLRLVQVCCSRAAACSRLL